MCDPSHSRPLAAIDVGSNTVHLVVAEVIAEGTDLRVLADEQDLTRLGADVAAMGAISEARMQRARGALQTQVDLARARGAEVILGLATEGVRAASNAAAFLRRMRDETGLDLALVTGDQEGALTYWGATSGPDAGTGRRAVVDLGGGSLEIVTGIATSVEWRVSLPLGSGAVHARYAPADPPDTDELATAGATVAGMLAPLDVPDGITRAFVCGGTATALATAAARLESGENPPANGKNDKQRLLTAARLDLLLATLTGLSAADAAATFKLRTERAHMLAAGAVVLRACLDRLGVDALTVSRRGIREGALLAWANAGDRWLDLATTGSGW